MNKTKTIKAICEKCKQKTNHSIVHDENITEIDSYDGIVVAKNWQIVKCNGCDNLSFRYLSYCSEDEYSDESGLVDDGEREMLFPKRTLNTIECKSFYYTPSLLRKIYHEIVTTFNEGCNILAVIGIRALLEGICKEEKIDGKDLSKKIDGLIDKGIITKNLSKVFHEIRKLGNEVTHELEELNLLEIKNMIEIIENIIENLYELPNKSETVIRNKESRK